jgi:hypothetical protein
MLYRRRWVGRMALATTLVPTAHSVRKVEFTIRLVRLFPIFVRPFFEVLMLVILSVQAVIDCDE